MRDNSGRFVRYNLSSISERIQYISDRITFNNGCWEFKNLGSKGYGISSPLGRIYGTYKVHRIMYIIVYGGIEKNLLIRHMCHNPKCCNPKHLKVGTSKDNVKDMYDAGRQPDRKGIKSVNCKLTEKEILEIYSKYGTMSCEELGHIYGVSAATVCRIGTEQTYTRITKRNEERV